MFDLSRRTMQASPVGASKVLAKANGGGAFGKGVEAAAIAILAGAGVPSEGSIGPLGGDAGGLRRKDTGA